VNVVKNTANPTNCFEDLRLKNHGSEDGVKVSSIVRRKMIREAQRTRTWLPPHSLEAGSWLRWGLERKRNNSLRLKM
jgi:hypothetical protein